MLRLESCPEAVPRQGFWQEPRDLCFVRQVGFPGAAGRKVLETKWRCCSSRELVTGPRAWSLFFEAYLVRLQDTAGAAAEGTRVSGR